MKINLLKTKSIFICFSSQTVSSTEADSKEMLPNTIPNLTRTITMGSTQFTVPLGHIEAKVDDTDVKIDRTAGTKQLLEDILDDFPDAIREIVAARIESQKTN